MSAKGLLLTLSFAGSAVGLACWMLAGEPADHPESTASPKMKLAGPAQVRMTKKPVVPSVPDKSSQPAVAPVAKSPASPQIRQQQVPPRPLTTDELTARAARVEQEANHDLRRLVKLLDLSEAQQDRVFETLAQQSPSWSPEMQFAPATGAGAAMTGKRSEPVKSPTELYAALPGGEEIQGPLTTAPPLVGGEITAPLKTPDVPGEEVPSLTPDPMDEIMAILNPDQQDTLAQEEADRLAWWAEILDQIAPLDEVPDIDGGTPPAVPPPGNTQTYEGSDTLE